MSDSPRQPVNRDAWWTRDHVLVIVLFVATGILVVLCWKLVQPFVTPLAWALALAVVAHPLHGWLARRIKKPGLAAGIAVFAIALVLTGLVIFVGQTLVSSIASRHADVSVVLSKRPMARTIGTNSRVRVSPYRA